LSVSCSGDSNALVKPKACVKSRHETFNSHLKGFNVLIKAFGHGSHQQQRAFESVCICIQYDIENGFSLFEVKLRTSFRCLTHCFLAYLCGPGHVASGTCCFFTPLLSPFVWLGMICGFGRQPKETLRICHGSHAEFMVM
jgi:hypothetical protein